MQTPILEKTMQTQSKSTFIDSIFYVIGFVCCALLTVLDYYTSFTGVRNFVSLDASDLWRLHLPLILAGVAVTFTASSAVILEYFFTDNDKGPKVLILMTCFFVAIGYDLISSFLGTVGGITATADSIQALGKASHSQILFSVFSAGLMLLGSFLVSKFFYLLKSCPGMIGEMFRAFGE